MKKLPMFFIAAGLFAFTSCDQRRTGDLAEDERLISRDTVVSEVEVRERVVEMDTTERTETIDIDRDRNDRNNNRGTGTLR
jgi:hypothetical protein